MSRKSRRRVVVPAALAVVMTAALVSCSSGGGSGKDASQQTAQDFLTAWQSGNIAKAASLTDNPQAATAQLTAIQNQLSPIKAEYDAHAYTKAKGSTPGGLAYSATYTLQGITDPVKWDSQVPVVQQNGKPVVHWTQTLVHPQLAAGDTFSLTRTLPPRAAILDKNGQPLSASVPVVSISLWPAKMTNPDAVYAALADPVFQVDVNGLKQRVAASNPNNAVAVVTLRQDVWDSTAKAKLQNLDGIVLNNSSRQVATGVAKYLVGTVQQANADLLKNAGPSAAATDDVGATGLQYRYQQQLAGTPTVTLAIVDANKSTVATLVNEQGKPGTPVKTTIDPKYQTAAENLIKTEPVNGAIVAIQPSTGDILADANNPPDGTNRGFTGQYPPGSTMKMITSSALLANGVNITDPVQCPQTVTVNGQSFENEDMFTLPPASTTLVQDFAASCNTAFISLRDKLPGNDTLTNTAKAFGFGGTWDVGLPTFDGSVPVATTPNDKAADMIGQGQVLMSPLDMASVAATIQNGTFHQPVLVPDQVKPYQAPVQLDPTIANNVRTLMRAVVTSGTASGLKGAVPGDMGAKTGTAEFGTQNPPQMHAWLVVWKDDLAVCILLENGGANSNKVAIMKQFLQEVQ